MLATDKRMIARMPADPKYCPKCGHALIEEQEPELHRIEGGNDVTIGGGTTYWCMECECFWQAEQIPDHVLYDPQEK